MEQLSFPVARGLGRGEFPADRLRFSSGPIIMEPSPGDRFRSRRDPALIVAQRREIVTENLRPGRRAGAGRGQREKAHIHG